MKQSTPTPMPMRYGYGIRPAPENPMQCRRPLCSMLSDPKPDFDKNRRHFRMMHLKSMPKRQAAAPHPMPATDPGPETVPGLTAYFTRLFEQQFASANAQTADQLVLPPISSMAPFLGTTTDEILRCLRALKKQGYDFCASGKFGLVTIWPT
ncbi:MAG: hypothetical protein R2857_12875 [Vampirovibrionales bacterium]